jgi:dihydrofolate reductase
MRKIILFNLITLDGFFEGLRHEIDWHNVDEEFNDFSINQLHAADGLIFGRVTYEMMTSFWPSDEAITTDPVVASLMNAIPKIVFSKTLEEANWNNTRLVKDNVVAEISKLKQQPGKDWYVFGSADLATTLIQNNLIDEYRILVNPIVLGSGIPLFKGIPHPLKLRLLNTRVFQNGNVLLTYQPDRSAG